MGWRSPRRPDMTQAARTRKKISRSALTIEPARPRTKFRAAGRRHGRTQGKKFWEARQADGKGPRKKFAGDLSSKIRSNPDTGTPHRPGPSPETGQIRSNPDTTGFAPSGLSPETGQIRSNADTSGFANRAYHQKPVKSGQIRTQETMAGERW